MNHYYADSHVHLHAYDDVDGVLRRAEAAGVHAIVAVGVDLPSGQRNIEIARLHPMVIAGVGLHPMSLGSSPDASALAALAELAVDPAVGFVGEIGIDTVDGTCSLDLQRTVLAAQLATAWRLGKPVNLHLRGEVTHALRLLRDVGVPPAGAVFHYFVGDRALAEQVLDQGLYISVGKPVTRPLNAALREAVADVPLDRLLLETDSYPLPGRTTEPADVVLVAQAVADLKTCSVERVAEATSGNLRRLVSGTRETRTAGKQTRAG